MTLLYYLLKTLESLRSLCLREREREIWLRLRLRLLGFGRWNMVGGTHCIYNKSLASIQKTSIYICGRIHCTGDVGVTWQLHLFSVGLSLLNSIHSHHLSVMYMNFFFLYMINSTMYIIFSAFDVKFKLVYLLIEKCNVNRFDK